MTDSIVPFFSLLCHFFLVECVRFAYLIAFFPNYLYTLFHSKKLANSGTIVMAAVANPIQGGSLAHPQPIVVEENSTLLKALSYVPLVGIISSLIQEISLAGKITQTADAPRLIELINVKNQYKVANVIRNLVTAALIVAGIALKIIGGTFAFGAILTAVHIGVAGVNIYRINKNKEVINELQATGFRPGMQFT